MKIDGVVKRALFLSHLNTFYENIKIRYKGFRPECVSLFVLVVFQILISSGCSGPAKKITLKNEKDFQTAFNEVYFDGYARSEVRVKYGRVDLLTAEFAIEVDRLSKFHEGIGQALHYAEETGKKPGLALFILAPRKQDLKKLDYVSELCKDNGIRVWYINDELEKAGKL